MAFITKQQIPLSIGDAPPQTRQTLHALVSVVNKLNGSGTSGAVSRGDLISSGVITASGSKPGNTAAIPSAIIGFTATGVVSTILLQWNPITQSGFSHVEVWRSLIDDISTAVMVGTAVSPMYGDTVPDSKLSVTYYYWVRSVNTNGISGAYNATAGTSTSTANDPAYMLGVLTGQLTNTQLHADLSSRIDLIDVGGLFGTAPLQGLSLISSATKISGAAAILSTQNKLSADSLLANAVAAHDGQQTHFANKGNLATVANDVSIVQNNNASEVTARLALEAKLNTATALYSSSSTAAADALTVIAGNTTVMQAQIDGNTAGISDSNTAATNKVNAEAASRKTLQASLMGTTVDPTGLTLASLSSGMIHEEKTARVSDVGSINTVLQTIQGAVDVAGSINYAVNQTKNTANAYADSAVSSSNTTLRAEFNSIKTSWDGSIDPSLANYIHYGDLWFDTANVVRRWSMPLTGVTSGAIIGASNANPVSITSTAHSLTTGQRIQIESVGGMAKLNLNQYIIAVVNADTFTLDGIDGTTYGVFSASGNDIWTIGEWQLKQDNKINTLAADIQTEATARANADTSQTHQITTAQSGIKDTADASLLHSLTQGNALVGKFKNQAAIQTEATTRVNAVQAEATRIDALVAGFVSPTGSIQSAIAQETINTLATADTAAASRVATLQTSVGANTASVQAQQLSINGLSAQYTIKTDVNGKIAGFGLANTGNANPSAFEITADQFFIAPPVGSAAGRLSPFIVDATTNMVRMDGASIVNGTITNAHIANLLPEQILGGNFINPLKISGAGSISTGNATAYNAGVGMWADANTFRIGNPVGNNLKWDGSSLLIAGKIVASSGSSLPYGSVTGAKPPSNATNGATATQADKLAGIATGADVTTTTINSGVVTTGHIILQNTGYIKAGQWGFNAGNGFWLESHNSGGRVSLGSSSGQSLVWDGASLIIDGQLVRKVNAGTIPFIGYVRGLITYFTSASYIKIEEFKIVTVTGVITAHVTPYAANINYYAFYKNDVQVYATQGTLNTPTISANIAVVPGDRIAFYGHYSWGFQAWGYTAFWLSCNRDLDNTRLM